MADEFCLSWYCMHAISDAAFSGLPSWKRIGEFRVSTHVVGEVFARDFSSHGLTVPSGWGRIRSSP